MDRVWYVYDFCWVFTQGIVWFLLDLHWILFGIYMIFICIYGVIMNIYDVFMMYLWDIYGYSMVCNPHVTSI